MKKTLLSIGILSAMAFSANAQDVAPAGSEFKPSAGNITVEMTALSPFSGGGAAPFDLNRDALRNPYLRFRYFLSDGLAFRLQLGINASKSKQDFGGKTEFSGSETGTNTNNSGSSTTTSPSFKVSSNSFLVAIAPGLEVHKGISERLSVYYGAYIDFAMQSAKGKIEGKPGSSSSTASTAAGTGSSSTSAVAGEYSYEVKGQNFGDVNDLGLEAPTGTWSVNPATGAVTSPAFGAGNTADALRPDGQRGFTRLGLVGVLGADYYITKGIYLGVEVSWGWTNYMYKKVSVEEKATNINNSTNTNGTVSPATPANVVSGTRKVEENKDSNWNITPAANLAFRLGFWF
jgi:outer membrane protein W